MADTTIECTWVEDEDGVSHTSCGKVFALDSGTPAENGMRFCCYCGKPMAHVPTPVLAPID